LPTPAQLVGEEVVGLEGGEEEVVDCIIEVCTEEVVVGRGGSWDGRRRENSGRLKLEEEKTLGRG
jgi:hypothetical protein